MQIDYTHVLVAVIGAVATVITAWLGRTKAKKTERKFIKSLAKNGNVIGFAKALASSVELFKQIHELHETTELDRFIIFVADLSDKNHPTTDAYLELREGEQSIRIYRDVPVDTDYTSKLTYIRGGEHLMIDVAREKDSLIKTIYVDEGVVYSIWSVIYDGGDYICYCSNATHSSDGISSETMMRCTLVVNRFRALAKSVLG